MTIDILLILYSVKKDIFLLLLTCSSPLLSQTCICISTPYDKLPKSLSFWTVPFYNPSHMQLPKKYFLGISKV